MYGLDSNYLVVTRVQHEQDVRRAAEFRMVREHNAGKRSVGLIWKLFSLLAVSESEVRETPAERTPQPAAYTQMASSANLRSSPFCMHSIPQTRFLRVLPLSVARPSNSIRGSEQRSENA